ncbi:hypothetical protein Hanom_Chr17g01531521 [Helianthus anomalus]
MFVHLTKRAKVLVRVRLFNKRTNTNERSRTHYRTFTWHLFMFVHLTKRTKFLVRVGLLNERTNTNKLSARTFGLFAALTIMT